MIQYGRQSISEEDIEAVVDVLKSDFLTQGPANQQFGRALSQYCEANYALPVSNGTAALHLACLALEIGAGDTVWVSAVSFVASANCAAYCGADVDFVDIDPETGLICLQALEEKLRQACCQNRLPKAIVVVHLAGQSCDMAEINSLCEPYNIRIIEDACHALGGRYHKHPVGNCRYSDLCVFSFHPVKPITSGEGGALLTNDLDLAKRAQLYANHGITKKPEEFLCASHGPWYSEMQVLGYNYRLTDIQAALGLSQLKRIDQFTARRNALADHYDQLLADLSLPVQHLRQASDTYSAYHLYVVRYSGEGKIRSVFEALQSNGIGCQRHYIPIFLHPYYQETNPSDYPGAMEYYRSAITLPLYADLTEFEVKEVINALTLSCR